MADNPRPQTAIRDVTVSPLATMPDTRRTSTSSNGAREASASMHASITSVQSEVNTSHLASSTVRRPRPGRASEYGTMQSSTSSTPARNLTASQPLSTPKRPGPTKRTTSSAAPHRGDTFSAEDDPNEVDEDNRLHRLQSWQDRGRDKQLKRRESTLRRRPTAQAPQLQTVDSYEADLSPQATGADTTQKSFGPEVAEEPSSEETLQGDYDDEVTAEHIAEVDRETDNDDDNEENDPDESDAESFTLKDRQEAINETHPFGIRIWKPALYKKTRSVQRGAEGDIHSAPQQNVNPLLWSANALWTLIFGWWLALFACASGIICMTFSLFRVPGCRDYGYVLINLAHYLFYPFGKYVRLDVDETYRDEDEGEGRSLGEYERWQTGDLEAGRLFFGPSGINSSIIGRRRDELEDPPLDESDPLLGRPNRQDSATLRARAKTKKRLFGRGKWDVGRVIFFLSFYSLIAPCLLLVSGICWFLVFSIPMGKVTLLVFYHLRRHPLALSFHVDRRDSRQSHTAGGGQGSVILLCTYRAVGLRYWKYTIDGTNIFLINLLGLVAFTIFDYFVLYTALEIRMWFTAPGLVFVLGLASIIPLAYFIGQAVASISAQSSMGVGATVNAFFSTIVEVFLYCVALKDGKAKLVEGSIIGSVFAAVLFLPGLSMCFGAIKRKTQRFNAKSQSVTSTMLLFSVIGAFGPTLFYQIYGTHELNCHQCTDSGRGQGDRDCRRCYFAQVPAINDRFFLEAVRPYIYFASICMFLSYMVGLLFTLRTHAAVIWNNEPDEKKEAKAETTTQRHDERQSNFVPGSGGLVIQDAGRFGSQTSAIQAKENIRESQVYKRILAQSLRQAGLSTKRDENDANKGDDGSAHVLPPKSPRGESSVTMRGVPGLSTEENRNLFEQVAEMAATAAAVAARDATKPPKRMPMPSSTKHSYVRDMQRGEIHAGTDLVSTHDANPATTGFPEEGGHNAPQWSRTKSAVILLTATIAYAVIAEILVDTVDSVLSSIDIDEKFLGITLFALVPNTTEFLNAISFAMNGNVALSMEIGSSYALQVILLQAPCLVLFSAAYTAWVRPAHIIDHSFLLLFPQWDMITVILGTFLMAWIVGEGKSNYFKGSILIFTYLVFVVGFYFSGFNYQQGGELEHDGGMHLSRTMWIL